MFKHYSLPILMLSLHLLVAFTAVAQQQSSLRTADSLLNFAELTYLKENGGALTATQQALQIAQHHNSPLTLCRAYSQLGLIYTNAGFYPKALEELHKALSIARENRFQEMEAYMLTSIGNVYYHKDSLARSLTYYEQSLRRIDPVKNEYGLARNLSNMGLVNRWLGNYDSAESCLRRALKLHLKLDHQRGICSNYENLGALFLSKNQLDSAQTYFSLALLVAEKADLLREQAYIYRGMALLKQKSRQGKEAKAFFEKALLLSKQTSTNITVKEILLHLSQEEERVGNYKQALKYQREYISLSDSLNNLGQRAELKQFQNLLDAERNISENRILKANVAAREHELKASIADHQRQLTITIAAGVALAGVIGIMFFLLYHFRQNQKNHEQLQKMHAAIQLQARELEEANQKIQEHNHLLENHIEERTRQLNQQNKQLIQYAFFNAHKVRGPLARIMGLVNLLPMSAHQVEFQFILNRLNDSAQELDKVVHEINLILEGKPVNQDN